MVFQSMTIVHFLRLVSMLGLCTHSKPPLPPTKTCWFPGLTWSRHDIPCINRAGHIHLLYKHTTKMHQLVFVNQNRPNKKDTNKDVEHEFTSDLPEWVSQLSAINAIK